MSQAFSLEEVKSVALSSSASGDATVITNSSTTQRIAVVSYVLVNTTANSVTWKFGAVAASGVMDLAALGVVQVGDGTGVMLIGAAGANLVINLLNATKVAGHVSYILV